MHQETLRLNPVLGLNGRAFPYDIVLNGYNVPAGTIIQVVNYSASRDERNFDNALSFCPARHNVRGSEVSKFASSSFGLGARMCPGRRIAETELYLALGTVLQHYRLKSDR